ncbi:MAG: hypothetical protein COX29_03450 [Candidatus Moranbacteria bacterium CG23_combo_of_CG06-09_8_20_14_all_35_22]|nr:MAG: hypothetical protein COX29_03450 [Candidatus Moranbacteria bacterium CG23_combo_of_CG06-09_8_20_14_all_35_22]
MFYIILALYAIIFITYLFLFFFIIYHLARYSINAKTNKIMLPIFVVVSILLFLSNIMLFFSVDWNALISKLIIF